MENNKNNSSLKTVIVILAVLLLGSLVYIFKMSSEIKEVHTEITKTTSEKESVMKNLQDLKTTYDAAIAENTSMSEELIQERDKVVNLMNQLKKADGDLSRFKNQMQTLQKRMNDLILENKGLKTQNSALVVQRDSTMNQLVEKEKTNVMLTDQNNELAKTVEKGSKLSILNLQASAYKLKNSGKEIATDKATRANVLKISFLIAENSIAKSGDKDYYIQVIDSKNNVLGDSKTVNFGDKYLVYSFITSVRYENKTVQVSQDLPGKNFAPGIYTVNIFDKNQLVSTTNFSLK